MKAKWIIYWLVLNSNVQLLQPAAMNIHLDLTVCSALNCLVLTKPLLKLRVVRFPSLKFSSRNHIGFCNLNQIIEIDRTGGLLLKLKTYDRHSSYRWTLMKRVWYRIYLAFTLIELSQRIYSFLFHFMKIIYFVPNNAFIMFQVCYTWWT